MENQDYNYGDQVRSLLILCIALMLAGCTYSITMVHTEGEASDVVDETATNTPTTRVTLPVSSL